MNKTRIEKFIGLFNLDADAALIISASNIRYLTEFNSDGAGIVLITRNKGYFIIDSRYYEAAKKNENDFLEVILQKKTFEQIKDICANNNVKSIALEKENVTLASYEKFKENLGGISIIDGNLSEILSDIRAVKEPQEIDKIKSAQQITDTAFSYILERIEEGRSEKDLALELEFFMRKNGADAVSFEIIFVSGPNSSLPHGVPTNRKLQAGDFITIDFGADFGGYKSDMTRTVALKSVSDEQKQVYETVLKAQLSALNAIKAGKVCKDIDKIARDVIKNAGYGEYFGHALGHSVGLDIHESPNFSPLCDKKLNAGMILSVEPGIYIPQKFGVRIEDLVLITENGHENLTKSNKSLIIL